jgi:hypothetical protein
MCLEEVKKYSFCSPSSLIVIKLISVERNMRDSAFMFLMLAVFSGFNCLLSALISSKLRTNNSFLVQIGLQCEPCSIV